MRNLATLLLSVVLVSGALAAQDYVPFSLRSLGAGSPQDGTTVALGINDSGVIAGTSRLPLYHRHACYWLPNGAVTDIGTLGGTYGVGFAINNQGQIVGGSTDSGDVNQRAFLWTPGVGMQALPSLGLGVQDAANAINNNGAVVGYSCLGSQCTGDYHAFLWTPSGGIQDLGTLPGGVETFANGINSANHVVGTVQLPNNRGAAFIWTPTTGMQELAPGSGLQGYGAVAINDSDEVIGSFDDPADNQSHAFLWTQAHGLKDLGVLPGGWSEAMGINKSGDVVGFARDASNVGYSVIWRQGGTIQKLAPLAGVGLNEAASGINMSGEIAANGSKPYLLKPTFVKLSSKSVNFGSWPVGQTSTVEKITLTNLGSTPLAISSIKITGVNTRDFSEKNTCGLSLAPGATCVIKITFTPEATGERHATIYVADSDWTSPQHVSLLGTGS